MTTTELKSALTRKEGVEIEYKSAKGGLPGSMWETASAFANTNGGVIVLGVSERKDGTAVMDGLTEEQVRDYKKKFWDTANNRQKLSVCCFVEKDVHEECVSDSWILVVEVARADYRLRPVFLNGNPYGNTFKRNHEGDYHCTDDEVRQMFSDANRMTSTPDARILHNYSMDDIDLPTLDGYRREFKGKHENHPWTLVDDFQFLKNIGAYRVIRETGEEGFTVAGILMFGKTESITDQSCLPYFFPDYRQHDTIDPRVRWTDRIYPDGRWEANLYNFFNKVLNRLFDPLPKPFMLDETGKNRVEYTTAHLSVREALANTCIHAAYTQMGNITVDRYLDRFELSNPGTMLVSVEQFYNGKQSVCRNPQLQKMFVLLGIGEKAGSGADVILQGWDDNKWEHPVIEEKIRPDRVVMTLSLEAMSANINRHQTDIKPTTNRQQPTTNQPQTTHNGQETDNKRTRNGQQTDKECPICGQQLELLQMMQTGERSMVDFMKRFNYKKRESLRKALLNDLIKEEYVEMTHPENINHRSQRYRLTEKGKKVLGA